MIKLIVVMMILVVGLVADTKYGAEIKYTLQGYDNNVQDAYYVNRDNSSVEGSIELVNTLDKMTTVVKLSNRLEDTIVDKVFSRYDDRHESWLGYVTVGTISTMEGVFANDKTSVVQPPMVYKASGVYNDEWMSGLLDTVIGVEAGIGYLTKIGTVISVSSSVADIRVTDERKADTAVYNHVSNTVELEPVDHIKTTKLKYDSGSLSAFASITKFKLKSVDKSGLTDLEKKIIYVLDRSNFDSAWLTLSTVPYEFEIDRLGAMYTTNKWVVASEWFSMETTNSEKSTRIYNIGRYVYGAWYGIDDITPYVAYGWSGKNREHVIGVRKHLKDNIVVLGEYRKTDWTQVEDAVSYGKYVGDLGVYTLQVILRW